MTEGLFCCVIRKDVPWNSGPHPLSGLRSPKPDFAFGFKITAPLREDAGTASIWSTVYKVDLRNRSGLGLISDVAQSAFNGRT